MITRALVTAAALLALPSSLPASRMIGDRTRMDQGIQGGGV
ncbi:hypothetical protein ACFL41_02010 [Gemmatimonadota bacterium]